MPQPDQAAAFFAADADAPMVMVNLLKFKDRAEYPDGSDADLTGREAYLRYGAAVQTCLAMVGGRAVFSGDVTGLLLGEVEELWDMVALAYYPGPQAMLAMVALPEYQGIEVHRFAGLKGQLNIRTRPGLMSA
nr:DUF1330 domain-containing protein [Polymorphobacter fuscus]